MHSYKLVNLGSNVFDLYILSKYTSPNFCLSVKRILINQPTFIVYGKVVKNVGKNLKHAIKTIYDSAQFYIKYRAVCRIP